MDYPKSVPGVGLVGGQFADEDQVLGRQGSLIPSAWGNTVTEELLNLIRGAGGEPDEGALNQVATLLLRNPTESLRGMPKKASPSLARSFSDDATMLTPLMLAEAFKGGNQSLSSITNGFQKIPGGYIRQHGYVNIDSSGTAQVTFPVPFPSLCLGGFACEVEINPVSMGYGATGDWQRTGMRVTFAKNGAAHAAGGVNWEAWGI